MSSDVPNSVPKLLLEKLLNDPIKRQLVLQILNQNKKLNAKDGSNTPTKSKKPEKKYESPTSLFRRKALEKLDNIGNEQSSSNPSTPKQCDGQQLATEQLLKGVVAFVDVKKDNVDRSEGIKEVMRSMGAVINDELTRGVTHVIFKGGSFSTYQKARLLKCHLVSVLWLHDITKYGRRVPESQYRAFAVNHDESISLTQLCSNSNRRKTIMTPIAEVSRSQSRRCSLISEKLLSHDISGLILDETPEITSDESTGTKLDVIKRLDYAEITSDDSDCGIVDGYITSRKKRRGLNISSTSSTSTSDLTTTNKQSENGCNVSKSLISRKTAQDVPIHSNLSTDMDLTNLSTKDEQNLSNVTNNDDRTKTISTENLSSQKNKKNSLKSNSMSSLHISANSNENKNNNTSTISMMQISTDSDNKNNSRKLRNTNKSKTNDTTTMSSLNISESDKSKRKEASTMSSLKISESEKSLKKETDVNSDSARSRSIAKSETEQISKPENDDGNDIFPIIHTNIQVRSKQRSLKRINNTSPNKSTKNISKRQVDTRVNSKNHKNDAENSFSSSITSESSRKRSRSESSDKDTIDSEDISRQKNKKYKRRRKSQVSPIKTNKPVENDPGKRTKLMDIFDSSSEDESKSKEVSKEKNDETSKNNIDDPIDKQNEIENEKDNIQNKENLNKKPAAIKRRKLFNPENYSPLKSLSDNGEREEIKKQKEIVKHKKPVGDELEIKSKRPSNKKVTKKSKENLDKDNRTEKPNEFLEPENVLDSSTRRSRRISLSQKTVNYREIAQGLNICSTQEASKKRRSTLDFQNKSQTQKPTKLKINSVKSPSIVCTKLHRPQVFKFMESVKKLGTFQFEYKVTKRTTHLVAGEAKRTINMLRAIARGCWILKFEWWNASLKAGRWLPEEDYELTEFSPAVQQCRLQRQAFGNDFTLDIFQDCGNIFIANLTRPPRAELIELVRLCKGKVTNNYNNAKIVVGELVKDDDLICVTEFWILDSITENKKKPLKDYVVCRPTSPIF